MKIEETTIPRDLTKAEEIFQTDMRYSRFPGRRSGGSIQRLSARDSQSIRLVFVRAMATVSQPSLLQSRADRDPALLSK